MDLSCSRLASGACSPQRVTAGWLVGGSAFLWTNRRKCTRCAGASSALPGMRPRIGGYPQIDPLAAPATRRGGSDTDCATWHTRGTLPRRRKSQNHRGLRRLTPRSASVPRLVGGPLPRVPPCPRACRGTSRAEDGTSLPRPDRWLVGPQRGAVASGDRSASGPGACRAGGWQAWGGPLAPAGARRPGGRGAPRGPPTVPVVVAPGGPPFHG